MINGDRLREMRKAKQLSQDDIEKRTGLPRCYISRVENGHTVPAIETLEKMARDGLIWGCVESARTVTDSEHTHFRCSGHRGCRENNLD